MLSEYSKFDHIIDDDDEDNNDVVPSSTTLSVAKNEIRHVRKHSIILPATATAATTQSTKHLRFLAQYNGITVYEWEQSLNEVIIYIVSPLQKGNKSSDDTATMANANSKIICHITATNLKVGIQQHRNNNNIHGDNDTHHHSPNSDLINYYIDEDIYYPIETKESTWCIEQEDLEDVDTKYNVRQQQQDVITIYLQKVAKGMVWEAPLRGRNNNNDTSRESSNSILDPISLQDVQKSLLLERWQEENPGMDFSDATFNGGSIPDPRTYMGGIGYQ